MQKKTHTFTVTVDSEMEERNFNGTFTVKTLSMSDRTKVNVLKSQRLGGFYCCKDDDDVPTGRGVDYQTDLDAYVLAYLEVAVTQKPDWFIIDGPDALQDSVVVYKVFEEASKFEKTFRVRKRTTAEESDGSTQGGEGTSAPEPAQANAGNGPKKVVGREVQAALDA